MSRCYRCGEIDGKHTDDCREAIALLARAEKAEAQRDRLRAALERLRPTYCLDHCHGNGRSTHVEQCIQARAALEETK